MTPLVIRPQDWPIAVASLICAVMILASAATQLSTPQRLADAPNPGKPALPREMPDIAYAPAPGRDDRTPIEYMDLVFRIGDPGLAAKLSGIGPVFWAPGGRGSGALIARDVVLTTAHLFVKGGVWTGGNSLLPIPPDPSQGSIFLAACGRSYPFMLIEVGHESPRQQLGLDYAIARLKEPACDAATVLKPTVLSTEEIAALTGVGSALLNIGAYDTGDLPRWAQHALMTGKDARADGLERMHVFGVA